MEPINYYSQLQAPDMMGKFAQGLQVGAAVDAMQQQRESQMAAQLQAQQAAEQYQRDMNAALQDGTPQAFSRLFLQYPQQREAIKASFDAQSEGAKKDFRVVGAQAWNAINSGRVDIARQMLEERITAAENAGQPTEQLYSLRSTLYENPGQVKGALALMISAIDPENAEKMMKGQETALSSDATIRKMQAGAIEAEGKAQEQMAIAKNAQERERAQIQQIRAQTGATAAQARLIQQQTRNLGIDAQQAVLKLEEMKRGATGGHPVIVDPEKRFEAEKKLRDDYQKRTAGFRDANATYTQLKTSAKDNTPAGDLALIFQFMKMLDPGSVVRESEFALAQNTAGLYQSLQNTYSKIQSGERLSQQQRDQFTKLAGQYYAAAASQQRKAQADLGLVVSNYQLNPQNVFGTDSGAPPGAVRESPPASAATSTPPPGAVRLKGQ